MRKATHRRVLIGMVHATLGEAVGETQAQSDEDSTVRDTGTAYKKGGHKLG